MTWRTFKELCSDSKGSTVVEVAIMFPIILALIFGFMWFTQAIRMDTILQVAAREAARQYAVSDSASRAVQKARDELALGNIDSSRASIRAYSDRGERKVTVTIPYLIQIPFMGEYPLKLQGSAVFRLETSAFY